MKRLAFISLILLATILVWLPGVTPMVSAAVIYDNGSPDLQAAIYSNFPIVQQIGDNFILNNGANVITDIHWWGVYFTQIVPDNDTFTLRIFDITSGVPNTSQFYDNNVGTVTRVDTGTMILGTTNKVFEYSLDVAPISLSPGAPYLLSIVNNDDSSWSWATSNQTDTVFWRAIDGNSWNTFEGRMAFNLTSVPEPSTLLLLGAGLAGVGIMRRKLRR